MSLVWAGAIVTRAKREGRITDEFATKTIIDEINKFGTKCAGRQIRQRFNLSKISKIKDKVIFFYILIYSSEGFPTQCRRPRYCKL